MRRAALAAALALVCAGCGGGFVRRTDAPAAGGPVDVGTEVGVTTQTDAPTTRIAEDAGPAPAAAADAGVLELVLRDQHDRRPQGIKVELAGPSTGSFVSDANGRVRFEGSPGTYQLAVPVGCYDAVHVTFGDSGRAGIVSGRLVRGELLVKWRARYAPDWPVHASFIPDFPLGQTVEVRFDVHDRCTLERMPDATYPTFAFEPSENVRLIEAPKLRADRNGWGHLRFTCLKEGPASLHSVDRRNEDDKLELLANASARTPVCKRL